MRRILFVGICLVQAVFWCLCALGVSPLNCLNDRLPEFYLKKMEQKGSKKGAENDDLSLLSLFLDSLSSLRDQRLRSVV